jgi:hypothetical protein
MKINKKKLRGMSPPANYSDQATAACQRMPTFADRGCHVVSVTNPYGRIFGFSRLESLLLISNSSSVVLTRLGGPRSRPTTSQKIW